MECLSEFAKWSRLVHYCILHFISRQLDHSHDLWIDVPLKLLGICLEEVLLVVVVTVD